MSSQQGTTSGTEGGGGASLSNDQLKSQYVGTGHADQSKYEFVTNLHRDSYASYIGHSDQLAYMAVAQNQSIGRTRLQFLQKMIQPCGCPPPDNKTTTTD